MYELIKATEQGYYIECPAKIGVIMTGDGKVCLIDSGNDKDAGKKVRRILEENGRTLEAIYNTHSHADHIGGNRYLQTWAGCPVFAPGIEAAFTAYPILEPSFLYGGNPPKELRHKFLLAEKSDVSVLTEESLPHGVSVFPLPGHTWDMVGYRTEDGAVYLADALSSEETLQKYGIGFLVDVAAYLETLEKIKNLEGNIFIPSHAAQTENITPLAEVNIKKVYEIGESIENICREPKSFEAVLKLLFEKYGLVMNFTQYALVGSTVKSYLSWLSDSGRIESFCENNAVLWRTKN